MRDFFDPLKEFWTLIMTIVGVVAWGVRLETNHKNLKEEVDDRYRQVDAKLDKIADRQDDLIDYLLRKNGDK